MSRSAIRHIATSYKGNKCTVAIFERLVSVWDLISGEKISQFNTCLDFGGSRLAISEDGNVIAAGAYKRYGVEMYRSNDGGLLWQRPDIKKVQYIRFEPWEGHLWACIDGELCHLLNVQTGNTMKTYKDVIQIISSSYHKDIIALERKKKVSLCEDSTGKEIFSIEKETFAVLSMAFTPDSICTSESGGAIRCFDLNNGSLQWRYEPPKQSHCIRLAYNEGRSMVYGVLWAFVTGGSKEICWFDVSTGEVRGQMTISGLAAETEFAMGGNTLVTSDGEIYNLSVKQVPTVQMHLNFPMDKG